MQLGFWVRYYWQESPQDTEVESRQTQKKENYKRHTKDGPKRLSWFFCFISQRQAHNESIPEKWRSYSLDICAVKLKYLFYPRKMSEAQRNKLFPSCFRQLHVQLWIALLEFFLLWSYKKLWKKKKLVSWWFVFSWGRLINLV